MKEIGKLLNAGTNCGSCLPELNGLLAEQRPVDDAHELAEAISG